MKYTSDYTTTELVDMGMIDELIKPLVIILTSLDIRTIASCEGHINDVGNCQYPWIDFHIDNLSKVIDLLRNYENRYEILIQLRNDKSFIDIGDSARIFPYCENLKDGRDKMKKLENFLSKSYITPNFSNFLDLFCDFVPL